MGSTPSAELATVPDGHAGEGSSRGCQQPRPTRTTRSHLVSLGKAHNKFALLVYQEIARDGKRPGNFVFCPIAVGLGIGLLYVGAKGNTREEIHKVMYLQEVADNHMMAAFAAMHWDFVRSSVPKGCTLEVAIRIFIPADHSMTPSYEIMCNNYELSWLNPVDFVNRHDLARKEINQWVLEHSDGKIADVIPEMAIVSRDTKVLLVCAVYVKVQWLYQFDIKKTSKASFYLPMKETLQVQMMYQQRTIRHCHSSKLDSDVIELPFANYHLKCYLILPKKPEGLPKVESKLSRSVIDTLTGRDGMSEHVVDIFLPKFSFQQGLPFDDLVQKTGIRDLFNSNKADLSGLDGTKKLFLSRLYHHIHFEFEEGGTNVTAGSSQDACCHITKASKTFRADHPFGFFIRDDRTEAVLFLGRVVRPVLA